MNGSAECRQSVLARMGAQPEDIAALLEYNRNAFAINEVENCHFPLPDEKFVATWREYAQAPGLTALQEDLVQFRFPIKAGISGEPEYLEATRKGKLPVPGASLELQRPAECRIVIHPTSAGSIPLLICGCREDFVTLVRALAHRNEPVEIPDSMGASMIAGYNNWGRIRRIREQWEQAPNTGETWEAAFRALLPRKELYQDRFILLSDGPYSGVDPSSLGLTAADWRQRSLTIRREHECAHYFTRRVFQSMRNNALDELIADYCGIVAAFGRYNAKTFLLFAGLEDYPEYRAGARLQNYRGSPPLSEAAFAVLRTLVYRAAHALERFDRNFCFPDGVVEPAVLVTLAASTLEELASEEADIILNERLARYSCSRGEDLKV